MALQDLTPQLRTRLSRMERTVGWFVLLATALLVFGFGYYIYNTAERKGWFIQKVNYSTSLSTATGLKEGDPVMLMGFVIGDVTGVEANGPWDPYGVTIFFRVKKPYFGYIWTDSKVKAASADFLGGRRLEILKGTIGVPTVRENTNKVATGILDAKRFSAELKALTAEGKTYEQAMASLNTEARTRPNDFYNSLKTATGSYWLEPAESPAVTERLEAVVDQVQKALPAFLSLTNQLTQLLNNGVNVTSNLDAVTASMKPAAANLAALSKELQGPGALGSWLLPPGSPDQIASALTNANSLVANTDTNLNLLVLELSRSLDSLANITSNLNAQVQVNTNIVTSISDTIVHSDEFIQGLKRHWLLRSAFKTPKTNSPSTAPSASPGGATRAPNDPFRK